MRGTGKRERDMLYLVVFQPLGLGCDLRPDPREIALGFLIGLRRRDPARQQLRLPVKFSVLEFLQRAHVVQGCQRFLVVEARENIAGLDGFAFASATLDDSAANQRRRARPGLRFDRSGCIDDFRGGAAGDLSYRNGGASRQPPRRSRQRHDKCNRDRQLRRKWTTLARRLPGSSFWDFGGGNSHIHDRLMPVASMRFWKFRDGCSRQATTNGPEARMFCLAAGGGALPRRIS